MKKIFVLAILLFIAFTVWGQTSNLTVYQVTPDSDTTNNRNPSIASNPNGDIMIVWRNAYRGMKYYYKKKNATEGVLAEIPNEPYPESEGYKIQWTSVRATFDGIFHVAWCNSGPYGGGITYASFNPLTEQWNNPEKITSGWTEDVHLRVSPLNGDLALIWCWYSGGAKYVYAQFKMGGTGPWTNQQAVAPKWTTNALSSFDDQGYLYVAWKQDAANDKDIEPAFSLLKKDTNGTYKYLGKVVVSGYPGWFFLPTVAAVEGKGFMAAVYEDVKQYHHLPFTRTGDTITEANDLKVKPVTASPGRWQFSSIALPFGEEVLYTHKSPATAIRMLRYKNGAFLNEPFIDLNNNMASNWLYDSQEDPNIGVLTAWATEPEPNRIFYSVWDSPLIKVKSAINLIAAKKVERSFFRMQYLYALTWENDPYNVEKGVTITKFNIYRRDRDSGQLWVKIDSVDANVLAYADKNVTAASYFEYYVTAVDNEGNESKIR